MPLTSDGDRRDVEGGAATGHLLAWVPARDQVRRAREQAALKDTEERAHGAHRLPVVREAETDRDDWASVRATTDWSVTLTAPEKHRRAEPEPGTPPTETELRLKVSVTHDAYPRAAQR